MAETPDAAQPHGSQRHNQAYDWKELGRARKRILRVGLAGKRDSREEPKRRNQKPYGPLTCGSDQKLIVPGLNRNFTPRLLLLSPSATTLPKASSASAVRPRSRF